MKINPKKNRIYIAERINKIFSDDVQHMCIHVDTFPVWYMGLLLIMKSMTFDDYQPLIDKIMKRLRSWLSKALSYDVRVQLNNFGTQQIFGAPSSDP